jgi:hypothetical protein
MLHRVLNLAPEAVHLQIDDSQTSALHVGLCGLTINSQLRQRVEITLVVEDIN